MSLLDDLIYGPEGYKLTFEKMQFGLTGEWEKEFPDRSWPKLEVTVKALSREEAEQMWSYCLRQMDPNLTREKFRKILEESND